MTFFALIDLDSDFGRVLVEANINIAKGDKSKIVTIMSSHLESLGSPENVAKRVIQIDYICERLKQIPNTAVSLISIFVLYKLMKQISLFIF